MTQIRFKSPDYNIYNEKKNWRHYKNDVNYTHTLVTHWISVNINKLLSFGILSHVNHAKIKLLQNTKDLIYSTYVYLCIEWRKVTLFELWYKTIWLIVMFKKTLKSNDCQGIFIDILVLLIFFWFFFCVLLNWNNFSYLN